MIKKLEYGNGLLYFSRLQFIEDSTRAYRWFDMTKDSTYIRKYLNRDYYVPPVRDEPEKRRSAMNTKPTLIDDRKNMLKRPTA
ncbi:MAG: hypothetical protein EOP04_11020 [Proteobacteria bacterium]|nr:MAG: hypothetical protein EOP04_11020 [Pseudomonadota bacterium]